MSLSRDVCSFASLASALCIRREKFLICHAGQIFHSLPLHSPSLHLSFNSEYAAPRMEGKGKGDCLPAFRSGGEYNVSAKFKRNTILLFSSLLPLSRK